MNRSYTFTVEWKDPVLVVAGDIDEATEKVYKLIYEKISSDTDQAILVELEHVGHASPAECTHNWYDVEGDSAGSMKCSHCGAYQN